MIELREKFGNRNTVRYKIEIETKTEKGKEIKIEIETIPEIEKSSRDNVVKIEIEINNKKELDNNPTLIKTSNK